MKLLRIPAALCPLLLVGSLWSTAGDLPAPRKTENVLWVLVDGFRWQELFNGAEEALLNKEAGGVADVEAVKRLYWRETPEARRAALLPFVWTVIGKEGQLYGNHAQGSIARVSNGLNFSYPGYSEMTVGFADARVDSNDKRPNPNSTVLEWLSQRPGFANRVAVFAAWDVVPFILNRAHGTLYINAGLEPVTVGCDTAEIKLLNRLKTEIPSPWGAEPFDALTFYSALEYLKATKPRLLYITFGETDEWGHAGRYDNYLDAARRTDSFLKTLWDTAQAMPEYHGTTTLLVVCDHGRGQGPKEWKNHGKDTKGSENIWLAVLGPDTPPLGECASGEPVILAEVAATIAAFLGEDYCAAVPQAAPPVAGVMDDGAAKVTTPAR